MAIPHTIEHEGRPVAVIVSGRAAHMLCGWLRLPETHRAARDSRADAEAVEVLYALVSTASAYAAPRVAAELERSAEVPGGIPAPNGSATISGLLSSMEVAMRLGCTAENVRALARRGSLVGDRDARGHWRFDADVVEEYIEQRGSS